MQWQVTALVVNNIGDGDCIIHFCKEVVDSRGILVLPCLEHTQSFLYQYLDNPLEPQYLKSQFKFLYVAVHYPQQRVYPSEEVAKKSLQGHSSFLQYNE